MPSAEVELYTVDAFTSEPFAGNPAAVCLLEDERSDKWLQAVAAEMNLSETAYLWRSGESEWRLRWFTPTQEVPLCGHATLATAHVLYSTGAHEGPVRFATRSGVLIATPGEDGSITLDFPTAPLTPVGLPEGVAEALGAEPLTAFVTGGALALAGVMMQALLRNPLADPYVLGISAGASVGALLALLLMAAAIVVDLAALGGAVAVYAVLPLAPRVRTTSRPSAASFRQVSSASAPGHSRSRSSSLAFTTCARPHSSRSAAEP